MSEQPEIYDGEDDKVYLRNLAERIFYIPTMFGVDQGDYDRLRRIARDGISTGENNETNSSPAQD